MNTSRLVVEKSKTNILQRRKNAQAGGLALLLNTFSSAASPCLPDLEFSLVCNCTGQHGTYLTSRPPRLPGQDNEQGIVVQCSVLSKELS